MPARFFVYRPCRFLASNSNFGTAKILGNGQSKEHALFIAASLTNVESTTMQLLNSIKSKLVKTS